MGGGGGGCMTNHGKTCNQFNSILVSMENNNYELFFSVCDNTKKKKK